jgi:4-hydroxy-2-oxoheptanedioate aldolase
MSTLLRLIQEDAKRIVGYSKYPPLGSRGYGPSFAIHSFPGVQGGDHYDLGADEALLVFVQIESKSGVENVEEIAKVDGVDVLLIGKFNPYASKTRASTDLLNPPRS